MQARERGIRFFDGKEVALSKRRLRKIVAKYGGKKQEGRRVGKGESEKRKQREKKRVTALKRKPEKKPVKKPEKKTVGKRERKHSARKLVVLGTLAGGGALAARAYLEEPGPGSGTVTLRDEQPGSLAAMLGKLLEDLLRDPQKKALADRLRLSVAIQDIDHPELAATVSFQGSDVTVSNGVAAGSDVYIGTELALLLSLSGAGKGLQVVRWLQSEEGQRVIKALRSGRFKIRGLAGKPVQMILFQKFLTPVG